MNTKELLHPGKIAFLLGTFSLIPQAYKVISTHDIDSFSLVFVILGLLSNGCWIMNSLYYTNDYAVAGNAACWVVFYIYIVYLVIMQRIGLMNKGESTNKDHIIKSKHLKSIFNVNA